MQTTGVVRRIDELGRIVIPKEIRKTLYIRNGENIEISVENDRIVLKKYSIIKKISDFAQDFADSINSFIKHNVIITDTDSVIAVSGSLKKEYNNQLLNDNMVSFISRRQSILEKYKKSLSIIDDKNLECTYVIKPIIVSGDVIGMLIILSLDEQINELDEKIAGIAVSFFNKYLEN